MATHHRILVAVDGSESVLLGAREAIRLARDQGGTLRFVHVVDESAVGLTLEGFVAFNDILDALRQSGRDALDAASKLARAAGIEPESELVAEVSGRVSDAIIDRARAALPRSRGRQVCVEYARFVTGQENTVAELMLGMADDGHAIAVDRTDLIMIELPENPSTGYRWSIRSKVDPILGLKGDSFQPPTDSRPGAGGSRRFEFSAAAAGSAKILLWNWREWEGEGSVAKRYSVTVTIR